MNSKLVVRASLSLVALVSFGVTGLALTRPQPKSEGTTANAPTASPTPSAATPGQAAADPMKSVGVFSPFVGEWTIDAAWDDGAPLKARQACRFVLGDKHLKYETHLPLPAGGEYQRYEGYFSWNAARGCLTCYSFAVDGGVSEYRVDTTDGKVFRMGFAPLHSGEEPKLRQTIEFTSPDAYTWTAEFREGETWKRIIKAEWKRSKRPV